MIYIYTNTTARQFQAVFRHRLFNITWSSCLKTNFAEDMTTVLATLPADASVPSPALSVTDDSYSDELSDVQQKHLVHVAD